MAVRQILALIAGFAATIPTAQATNAGTPLAGVLKAFATGGDDEAFSAIAGITWEGYERADSGTNSANQNFVRKGTLRLAGFGEVNLPKGVGADAKTERGNEGDSFISIAGFTMGPVYSVRVQKFYASQNYAKVLKRQLPAKARLVTVASKCALNEAGDKGDDSRSTFFRIELGEGDPIYARAFLSEGMKYTPELTLFEFSREETTDLITRMKCKVR
jgi:hypothetical protein